MAGHLISYHSRGKRRNRHQAISDINVTPFVDVMLVLLIIFMVTAPLLTVGVSVDLPRTQAAQINDSDEPLVISMNQEGDLFIQETLIDPANLAARLVAISGSNPDIRIFVRGDRTLPYGEVMALMGQITDAGFYRVALLAELPDQ